MYCISGNAEAQDRWSAEIRGGAAFTTKKLGEADLGTGVGFEGTVSYRFLPHLAAYAGWDWFHFTADEPASGDLDAEETGYAFGLKFIHPIGERPLSYFIRAGGTYGHIEIEDSDGDIVADSKHGLGWEIGAGLVYDLSDKWQISPGVRYRALSRDMEVDGVEVSTADLNYLAVEAGISFSF